MSDTTFAEIIQVEHTKRRPVSEGIAEYVHDPGCLLDADESNFDKIIVPNEFYGVTFQDFFMYMLKYNRVLVLAIYRQKKSADNLVNGQKYLSDLPFVVVIPDSNSLICPFDEAFILK